jgi:hypothetical protein
MVDEVVAFARVGVEELVVVFKETSPDPLARAILRFDTEVVQPALAKIAASDAA